MCVINYILFLCKIVIFHSWPLAPPPLLFVSRRIPPVRAAPLSLGTTDIFCCVQRTQSFHKFMKLIPHLKGLFIAVIKLGIVVINDSSSWAMWMKLLCHDSSWLLLKLDHTTSTWVVRGSCKCDTACLIFSTFSPLRFDSKVFFSRILNIVLISASTN